MPTRTSVPTAPPPPTRSIRDQFLEVYEEEHGRTLKVLRAFPRERADLRPHPKSKTALELAWMFVTEQGAVEKALTTGFDWSNIGEPPRMPESFDAILDAFVKGHKHVAGLISVQRDEELYDTIQFPTGPGRISGIPKIQFLWFCLHDQIHHRGQFSVYLRMADAKVPSIYGPSADERWF
jgi:uncharacterized damage-inducible protein DinB